MLWDVWIRVIVSALSLPYYHVRCVALPVSCKYWFKDDGQGLRKAVEW